MNIYGDQETWRWFVHSYKATGKRLDMGKSCVRFRRLDGPRPISFGEDLAP